MKEKPYSKIDLQNHSDHNKSNSSGSNNSKVSTRSTGRRGKPEVQVIPLGGLEEIGKNMTVIRCDGQAIIVDCGMAFPDDDLLGVDAVIPDFSYLGEIEDEIQGLVLTHGHEDHIGGIPFLLHEYSIPIFGTALTIGLVENKLKEDGFVQSNLLHTVPVGSTIRLGKFTVEMIHMNHSIPDSSALQTRRIWEKRRSCSALRFNEC